MVELRKRDKRLDRVFSALADHSRRQMLARLRSGPMSISDLAEPFSMSFAGVAKHIEVLAHAGLVRKIRAPEDGRSFRLQLEKDSLEQASEWMSYHQKFWNSKIDNLALFIEEEEHGKRSSKNRKKD